MVWRVCDSENCDFFPLSDCGWKALGNPPGSRGHKCRGSHEGYESCKVLLKENVIKATCKDSTVLNFGSPASTYGAAWAIVWVGQSYCARVNAATNPIRVKDELGYWKAVHAEVTEACPPMNPN